MKILGPIVQEFDKGIFAFSRDEIKYWDLGELEFGVFVVLENWRIRIHNTPEYHVYKNTHIQKFEGKVGRYPA